jgi:hypothetical protein
MSPSLLALLELLLVLGTVLGLAVWELIRLRRDMAPPRRDQPDDKVPADPD